MPLPFCRIISATLTDPGDPMEQIPMQVLLQFTCDDQGHPQVKVTTFSLDSGTFAEEVASFSFNDQALTYIRDFSDDSAQEFVNRHADNLLAELEE